MADLRLHLVGCDDATQDQIRRRFERDGVAVESTEQLGEIPSTFAGRVPDVLLVDADRQADEVVQRLADVKREYPEMPVILFAGDADMPLVVDAMRAGAFDFVAKPLDLTRLDIVIKNASQLHRLMMRVNQLQEKYQRSGSFQNLVGQSQRMRQIYDVIEHVSHTDVTVFITGESGTGKDLVARALHAGSLRSANMFLPYNCTSATRELADSQLFGHRRGSFTGAVADQPGVLRTAVGGTLFLDEVGDLPLDVQPKLLRFLEQGEILPVGDTRPQHVDVRVVAATNADLEQRVSQGTFREDLFYRLSVIRMHVPPLRDRREEIPHLSTFFLREASEKLGKPGVRLSAEALDLFDVFAWPGNVRQLRNEVQRAVALAPSGGVIAPDMLSPALTGAGPDGPPHTRGRRTTLAAAVEKLERELIESGLERAGGNISETARALGLTRRGLYLKMERLGVAGARHAF